MEIDYKSILKEFIEYHYTTMDTGIKHLKMIKDSDKQEDINEYCLINSNLDMLNAMVNPYRDIALEFFPEKKDFINMCHDFYMIKLEKNANRDTNTPE